MTRLAAAKKSSLLEALSEQLPIVNEGLNIGTLVPIGSWILQYPEVIEALCDWRHLHRKNFLSWFEPSFEKTVSYLENLAIADDRRLMFLIADESGKFIGQIGLAHWSEDQGAVELDNMLRGERGGSKSLLISAERTLLDWAFSKLDVKIMNLHVLQTNSLVIQMHKSVGFENFTSQNLRLSKNGYAISDSEDADNQLLEMRIERFNFKA